MESEQLSVFVSPGTVEGERIIKVTGRLIMSSLLEFQNALRAEKAPSLILDLSQVSYIDSAGLGAVAGAHVSCVNAGRHFAIVGPSERVRALFKIARMEQVLHIFPTVQDAERERQRKSAKT